MTDITWLPDPMESLREVVRKRRRLTYDCFWAIHPKQGSRVYCEKKNKMHSGYDGCMELASVLRGLCGVYCRECLDYEDGDGSGTKEE